MQFIRRFPHYYFGYKYAHQLPKDDEEFEALKYSYFQALRRDIHDLRVC